MGFPTQTCQPRPCMVYSSEPIQYQPLTGNFPKVTMNWFMCMSVKALVLRWGAWKLKVRGRRPSNRTEEAKLKSYHYRFVFVVLELHIMDSYCRVVDS